MRACALILAIASTGCSVGTGAGAVTGSLWINQCTNELGLGTQAAPAAFDLHASYFVALPIDDIQMVEPKNALTIRIQSAGNQIEEADMVFINVNSVALVAQQLDQNIVVGPDTNLRATLSLNRTCPGHTPQLELDGVINFSKFGVTDPATPIPPAFNIKVEDQLSAYFEFDVVDRRALTLGGVGSVSPLPDAGGQLAGFFNMDVARGRQAQPF
jgi:hypothetical protein